MDFVLIVLLVIICAINSGGLIAGGMGGGELTGTYIAEDSEIYAAEAAYAYEETYQVTIQDIGTARDSSTLFDLSAR